MRHQDSPILHIRLPWWLTGKESSCQTHLLEMQEMWVSPLGWEDPLE